MRREVNFRYDDCEHVDVRPFPFKDRDKKPQIFELAIGQKYQIEPINKRKNKKNRGRICTMKGIRRYPSSCGKSEKFKVHVIWQDDGRRGNVDPADLTPCSQ